MEGKSIVLTTQVEFEGNSYSATYFVNDDDVVHANIGGKVLLTPLAMRSAEKVVQALLTGHLLQQTRKSRNAGKWSGADK